MKTHIYFMPGLAASPKIFRYIKLPEMYQIHYLEWVIPNSEDESLQEYAKRMTQFITKPNPVLVGVSFGGIMVQEISKLIDVEKVIIISSIKNKYELPLHLKLIKKTKVYKLLPSKLIANINDLTPYVIGKTAKFKAKLYKKYLSVRDETYLNWSVYQVLHWQQTEKLPNLVHIQGTKDSVFPIQNMTDYIPVKRGTHIMILNKSKKISKLIVEILEK